MKISSVLKIATGALFIFVMTGCGSDSPDTVFIPGFNATWPVEGDENRQISLQPDEHNKGVEKGIFEGDEILQTENGEVKHPLKGSFNGLEIEFTITRENEAKVQYKGEMTPTSETNHFIVKITLNSSQEGSLVLSR